MLGGPVAVAVESSLPSCSMLGVAIALALEVEASVMLDAPAALVKQMCLSFAQFVLNMTPSCPKLAQFGLKPIPNLPDLAQLCPEHATNFTCREGAGSHALFRYVFEMFERCLEDGWETFVRFCDIFRSFLFGNFFSLCLYWFFNVFYLFSLFFLDFFSSAIQAADS